MSQRQYWRQGWDNVIAVADEFGQPGAPWDGGVKNYVYDVDSMSWVADTGTGGGSSDATAANQVTGNASLASIDTKLNALSGAFVPPTAANAVTVTYPNDVTEAYAYRTGGTGGSVVATITVVYVDDSKARVLSVART